MSDNYNRTYDDTDTKDAGKEMVSVTMVELVGWVGLIVLGAVVGYLLKQWKGIARSAK